MQINKAVFKPSAGWIVAGLMAAFYFGSGFQPGAEKTGVVDLNRVIQESNMGVTNTAKLNDSLKNRRDLMDFISTYGVVTTEQAETLKRLWLKDNKTESDQQQIDKIKKDVLASDKTRQDLMSKTTLTEGDRALLQDFSQRARVNDDRINTWDKEFSNDLNVMRDSLQQSVITEAKASLTEVAKKNSYTIIIESTVAPFGANDVTDETIKTLNAKKPK